jgi:hypothetical protein
MKLKKSLKSHIKSASVSKKIKEPPSKKKTTTYRYKLNIDPEEKVLFIGEGFLVLDL